MRIQTIELKEQSIVERDGEWFNEYGEGKKYPVFLTNKAIKYGYETGILDTSLYSDLVKIHNSSQKSSSVDEQSAQVIDELDQQKMISVIFLAFKGANKSSDLTHDEFMDLYHLTSQDTIMIYLNLIGELLMGSDNVFAKALNKEGKSSNKKKAK